MEQTINSLKDAVESSNIKNSRTLDTVEVGSTSLLTNDSLESTLLQTGTNYATQNNLQLSDVSRTKDDYDLLEIDWNYKNTTSKPFVQDTGAWTTANGFGTHLLTYNFPVDYFTSNHVLRNVGETFLSMRGDLHFVLTVQGSPMVRGALIVYPIYKQGGSIFTPSSDEINSWFFRQHAILDASDNSSTIDIVIPFKHYRNGIDPLDINGIYKVYVTVLVPLSGINSVSYTVTAFLENQEFKFLRPIEATTAVRRTQGLVNITNINNTLSDIENASLPLNMTGDTLTVKGMDDVGINLNPTAYVAKFNSLNNAKNPHYIEKMALEPSALMLSTKDTFNTTIDEMSVKHIMCEREHFINKFQITTATTVGANIWSVPVCPTIQLTKNEAVSNTMAYLCDTFKFWRGGLKFKIKFFINRFQSMKFYLGLFYKAGSPIGFSDWSSSHGVVFDIGGDVREIIVEIPYNSEAPWLHIPRNTLDVENLVPGSNIQWFDYILGTLTLYALTPLISPDAGPMDVIITMMGADDFEVANYCVTTKTAQAGELLLSKHSKRTPDYITDVVPNLKQYYTKWQQYSKEVGRVTTPFSSYVFSMTPQALLDDELNSFSTSSTNGRTNYESIGRPNKNFSKIGNFAGYRGGIKIRIEMEKFLFIRDYEQVTPPNLLDYYKPFCYFLNPDAFDAGPTQIQQFIDDIDNLMYTEAVLWSFPYIALPINNMGTSDTILTYEVEIPFQRNIKYSQLNTDSDPYAYGMVIFGFTKIPDISLPEHVELLVRYDVLAKIADDGRFGILNQGGFLTFPQQFNLVAP
jgi:hypothetical protein